MGPGGSDHTLHFLCGANQQYQPHLFAPTPFKSILHSPPPPPPPTSVQRPPLSYTHTPFKPIFDPAFHTHPAHLPLPSSTSEALASPPSTHSPSFSSRRASRNLKGLHGLDHAHDQAGCRSFMALAKQLAVLRAQFLCAR